MTQDNLALSLPCICVKLPYCSHYGSIPAHLFCCPVHTCQVLEVTGGIVCSPLSCPIWLPRIYMRGQRPDGKGSTQDPTKPVQTLPTRLHTTESDFFFLVTNTHQSEQAEAWELQASLNERAPCGVYVEGSRNIGGHFCHEGTTIELADLKRSGD